ncbi:MAG: hypothetical protein K2G45_07590 [Lachnospiraceae bacterium]|nr:hypothetical protein [Lachnospiraceae bacterium]
MKTKLDFKTKRLTLLLTAVMLLVSLTGCSDKYEKKYQNYIKSLIAINYLGATKDYIESTGANKDDADALYEANAEYLADSILSYYSIQISEAPDMRAEYVALAKEIYRKVNYKVSKAYKSGTQYCVDITIYPIDIFAQTSEEVTAYVERFNQNVSNGDYNDYTMEQYQTEFSTGMLEILHKGCLNVSYAEPVTVTVTIIKDGNTYYIGDHDFMAIDSAMIAASSVKESTENTDNTESEE